METGSLALFKCVLLLGLGAWTATLLFNNAQKSKTVVDAFQRVMAMRELRDIPAFLEIAERRAVSDARVYRLGYWILVVLQAATAVALLVAGLQFGLFALGMAHAAATAASEANIGLCLLLATWFYFLIGGAWFIYWIKMEGLQITHVSMLALTVASAVVVNMPS
jgi:predicted small integral membrane protein